MIDKRDLVMNQAMEILLDMLKEHMDDKLCNYVYFELTLGEGIKEGHINNIKNGVLKVDGTFKAKRNNHKKSEYYSIYDLINFLIFYLNISLRDRILVNREEEIIKKYGNTTYLWGVRYYLKKVLLGIGEPNVCYNKIEKMIEEYILT